MLLDSNVFILAATGAHNDLLRLFEEGRAAISAITRVEVLGYSRLDPGDESELRQLLDLVQPLPLTDAVLDDAIRLRQRKKMSLGDALIAGTALVYAMTLYTANDRDFSWIEELTVVNPTA